MLFSFRDSYYWPSLFFGLQYFFTTIQRQSLRMCFLFTRYAISTESLAWPFFSICSGFFHSIDLSIFNRVILIFLSLQHLIQNITSHLFVKNRIHI